MNPIITKVQYRLAEASVWRLQLTKKYTGDPRNQIANRMLGNLALADASKVSAETMAALAECAKEATFDLAIREASRDVGFRAWPETLEEFLRLVIQHMAEPVFTTQVPAQNGVTL